MAECIKWLPKNETAYHRDRFVYYQISNTYNKNKFQHTSVQEKPIMPGKDSRVLEYKARHLVVPQHLPVHKASCPRILESSAPITG